MTFFMLVLVGGQVLWPVASAEARENRHQQAKRVSEKPRYAHIVVDAVSGKVLDADSADELRHPASLTKVMTLYMTFAQLQAGKLRMSQRLPVSAKAAAQSPSKLGLRAGQTITVREAVLGLVTESANDASVVLAEAIGESESRFATLMTRQARRMGMSKTVYRNASGLPNPAQVTTARDQAILARAMIFNFPDYYPLFSTASFAFDGVTHNNHNRLMAAYDGMDGIKTGFIRASGFNLMASAMRNNKRLIGIVFGGRSANSRNEQMASLLDRNFTRFGSQLADVRGLRGPVTAAASSDIAEGDAPPPEGKLAANAPATSNTPKVAAAASPSARSQAAPVAAGETSADRLNAAERSKREQLVAANFSRQPAATVSPAPNGPSAVQLGQFRSLAEGQQAIAVALKAVPELSGSLFSQVQEINGQNGMVYRPRLLGLPADKAQAMCSRLLAKGSSCMVLASVN